MNITQPVYYAVSICHDGCVLMNERVVTMAMEDTAMTRWFYVRPLQRIEQLCESWNDQYPNKYFYSTDKATAQRKFDEWYKKMENTVVS